jgi:hypothetical protein
MLEWPGGLESNPRLNQLARFMADIIRNIKDRNFKSMVTKLKVAGWISDTIRTPRTKDKLGTKE